MSRDPEREVEVTVRGPLRSLEETLPGCCVVTPAPRESLADLGDRTLADLMALQQRIDGAKRALWALTAAPRPDTRRIEATMANITDLVHEQQDYFSRAIAAWMAARCEACRAAKERASGDDADLAAEPAAQDDAGRCQSSDRLRSPVE